MDNYDFNEQDNNIENIETGSQDDLKSETTNNSEAANVPQTTSLKTTSFYSENVKKPSGKKHNTVFQLILVAIISSILGGSIMGALLMFVAPNVQPGIKNLFGTNSRDKAPITQNAQGYKTVEILKSESPVTAIAEKVGPSVVGIRVSFASNDSFFGTQQGQGEGSGIIIRSDGYIMTNNHVIENAVNPSTGKADNGKIEVFLPLEKSKPYTAQVVGRDTKTDLAVLKIAASGLPAAELGDSDNLKVGELAVAIGNPGGLEYMGSVTVGVISGINRTISIEDNGQLKLIQTDAAINPGNSGGALVNSQGQVIGVNSAKIASQGFEGLGFAIPINKVKEITDSIISSGYVKGRPLLGVTIDQEFNEAAAKQYGVPVGLLVSDVMPFSGASNSGIKVNDIITKIDGKTVKIFDDLEKQKNTHKPGDTITLEIYRNSDKKTHVFKVVLGEMKQ